MNMATAQQVNKVLNGEQRMLQIQLFAIRNETGEVLNKTFPSRYYSLSHALQDLERVAKNHENRPGYEIRKYYKLDGLDYDRDQIYTLEISIHDQRFTYSVLETV